MRADILVGAVDELATIHAEDSSELDAMEYSLVGLEKLIFLSAPLPNLDATKTSSDVGITGVVRGDCD